jgi:hypothetical protein
MLPAPLPTIDEVPPAADRLPTLTEVVDMAQAAEPDPQRLVTDVLSELAPRIEMLLEARLREALAPALARAADVLIREARHTLNETLRELVEEAVARAIARRGSE